MMMSSGINLITTIIGFGLSATFIVFVCTRLICGRLHRLEDRQMFQIDTTMIDLELPEHQINGLEPVVVDAIPTMKFNREAFSSMEDAQCSICLAEYEEKQVLRIMPECGHSFHLSCIDEWLKKQSTCPVCRLSLQQDYLDTKHSPTTTTPHSFDSSEIITLEEDHSHQWLLPTVSRAQGHERNQMRSVSISIELESGVSRETILRSSSS